MLQKKADRVIAISKFDPPEIIKLRSIKEADARIDSGQFDVYLLHGNTGIIYKAAFGDWGYIPKMEIGKSHPRYKDILRKFD